MDLTVLRKKISSYRTPTGQIRNLPDDLLGEILHAWEQWTGTSKGFYQELETNQKKLAGIIGRAKKLKREGVFNGVDFTEITVEGSDERSCPPSSAPGGCNIELVYKDNIIRFGSPELLIDFLKKAA